MFGIQRNSCAAERGSILLVVLAILAVLGVSISGILMFGSWQRARGYLLLEDSRSRSLAESGINDAMATLAAHPDIRVFDQHLVFDSANQITYSIRPWGAYLQVRSSGIGRRMSRTLSALLGMQPPQIFDHVLTPLEPRYPLVVSGRTTIHGPVYVGSAGLTRGEINGRGFDGAQLVFGAIDTLRAPVLPRFSDMLLQEFLDSLDQTLNASAENDNSYAFHEARDLETCDESAPALTTRADIEFYLTDSTTIDSPSYYRAGRNILVRGGSQLSDVVLCASEVIVSDNARLTNCLIISDRVSLEGSCVVSGQVIVGDTLRVEANASLVQPALVLLRGRKIEEQLIGEVSVTSHEPVRATLVNGVSEDRDSTRGRPKSMCLLKISKQSRIEGLIWWEGLVALDGTISGAAATRLFVYDSPPTTYVNWMVDARVEFADLVNVTAFPLVFSSTARPRLHSMRTGR